jgi:c-di-GMP-binding flagellar brake protein YcgR
MSTKDGFMRERRFGFRVPYQWMMTSYVAGRPAFAGSIQDRQVKGFASDLSDSGMCLTSVSVLAPKIGAVVAVEFSIPGVDDSIWAAGTVCHRKDDHVATEVGVRFVAMAKSHARVVRDYCIEARREYLGGLLSQIRGVSAR